jgi:hypothetical protein
VLLSERQFLDGGLLRGAHVAADQCFDLPFAQLSLLAVHFGHPAEQ